MPGLGFRLGLGLSAAAGGGLSYLALPSASQLSFWYAGDGTVKPAEIAASGDGGLVTTWTDKGPSAYAPTQATAGAKPTYRQRVAQLNGRGAVEGDGGDSLVATIAAAITADKTVFTRYVVFRSSATGPQVQLVSEGNSASANPIVGPFFAGDNTSGKMSYRHRRDDLSGPNINSAASVNANDGNAHLVTIRRISATAWSLRLDGVEVGTATVALTGTMTIDRVALFARVSTTIGNWVAAQIACITDYGADNYTVIEPLLIAHYGISAAARQAGVWTWYNDPRAIRVGDYTYLGYVSVGLDGSVELRKFDHTTGKVTDRFTLHPRLQMDDHDNPGLLVRADGKLMAFYGRHIEAHTYLRIATNALPDMLAWDAEADLDAQLGLYSYTYANPIQLTSEENSPIYMFFRGDPGTGWAQYYSKSADGGATWAAAVRWLGNDTNRPYLKLTQNGNARIDFLVTDGHPDTVTTNSLYHGYYQGGNLYQSDGTLVGAIDAGPYTPSQLTKIYDGTTVRAWNWQIAIDSSGNPAVVYNTFPSTIAHNYRYARWSGSAWVDNPVCTAGTYLYSDQPYYSGGITLDPADVTLVYASRDTGDGIHQIWKYVTADGGAHWSATQLTSGPYRCFRPYVVPGHGTDHKLCYLRGRYTTYVNYDPEIVLSDG